MKKFFVVAMLSMMLLAQTCHADEMFDLGRSIGNAIGDGLGNSARIYRGQINKEFHKDKNFDFSKMKTFVVWAHPANGYDTHISSKYAFNIPYDVIGEKLEEYDIQTNTEVVQLLAKINPQLQFSSVEERRQAYCNYVVNTKDGLIDIIIHSYYQYQGNGYCDIEVNIYDTKTLGDTVFYFREQRLDVPNRQPANLGKTIMNSFVGKFKKTFTKDKEG